MLVEILAIAALAAWLAILLLPSRPWSTRERLDVAAPAGNGASLGRVTVLIPARNEAQAIGATVSALAGQGEGLRVVVIDDQSDDGTADAARAAHAELNLEIVDGAPLPDGWGGKLWALQQGLEQVDSEYCLLLDAEIVLAPGVVGALLAKAEQEDRALVSVMAKLRCESFWEKLLVPPFIYFFKLIYPFARVNVPGRRTAAAAGGCILVRTSALREVDAFASIRDALIDDCTLASRIKRAGHSIWLGLSDAVVSERAYPGLQSFRRMVTRTAFTQLYYSSLLLILVIALMVLVFLVPLASLVLPGSQVSRLAGAVAIVLMAASYWPTVRFYRLSAAWVLTLPLAASLFGLMTIESAVNYWRGVRAKWKGRTYSAR